MRSETRSIEDQTSSRSIQLWISTVSAMTGVALVLLLLGLLYRANYEIAGTHLDPPQDLPDLVEPSLF